MQRYRKIIGRSVILGIAGLLVVGVFWILFGGPRSFIGVFRSHRDIEQLKEEIRHAQVTIDSLHQEITRLTYDTLYIESIARSRLGMAKPTERVYKFIDKD